MLHIGTRDSFLALAQAKIVQDALKELFPTLATNIVPMTSLGDKVLDKPLANIGGKGLFCKELDSALWDGRIDIAVHSLKDVETHLSDGMELLAFLPRGPVGDGLVSPRYKTLANLPQGAIIGTASQRRKCQLLHKRPDLHIKLIRGNVRTRLHKLHTPQSHSHRYDAILLAVAGLHRIGLAHEITEYFDTEHFVPACGQGVLVIQCTHTLSPDIKDKITQLNCTKTQQAVTAERHILAVLDGTCHTPIGAYVSSMTKGVIRIDACVGTPDGKQLNRITRVCTVSDIMTTANDIAHELKDLMGNYT